MTDLENFIVHSPGVSPASSSAALEKKKTDADPPPVRGKPALIAKIDALIASGGPKKVEELRVFAVWARLLTSGASAQPQKKQSSKLAKAIACSDAAIDDAARSLLRMRSSKLAA
eukprot:2098964-Amphidinium_carterae.1